MKPPGNAGKRREVIYRGDESFTFSWIDFVLVLALVISLTTFGFLLFPDSWAVAVSAMQIVLAYCNPQGWGWKAYSVAFSIAIVVLVVLRNRLSGF